MNVKDKLLAVKSKLNNILNQMFPSISLKLRVNFKRGYEDEMRIIKYLCSKESVSLDVGANFGYYTFILKDISKYVYSFEPVPFLNDSLKKKFNKYANIKILNYAVSNAINDKEMVVPELEHGWSTLELDNPMLQNLNSHQKVLNITVKTNTLDNLINESIGFIKIDVEGHELKVIEGATNILVDQKPNLLIEIEERHKSGCVNETMRIMSDKYGYSIFFLHHGILHSVKDFNLEVNQTKSAEGDYVCNFIFIHYSKIHDFISATRDEFKQVL